VGLAHHFAHREKSRRAGVLTDDDKLRREGKLDQATGKVKQAVEKVVEKTKDVVKDLKK